MNDREHNRRRKRPHDRPQSRRTDWTPVAKWYDSLVGEEGSEFHREVVLPGTLKLLALQPGQTALDVACGQGVLCRLLQKQGVRVTGVDAAGNLLKIARQRSETTPPPEGPPIEYIKADARELSLLAAEYYDAAACVLSVQNISPLAPMLSGVARCLKSGGRLVIVMMHPCFRSPKFTSWGWEGAQVQYRRVDRYLLPRKEPIVTHPGSDPTHYTWTFHLPLQGYVKALRNAGLLLDALEEWPSHKVSQPGPRAHAENTARTEIPMFLALRAIKVAAPPAP